MVKSEIGACFMRLNEYVVSRDDTIYHAWPDLVLTKGGKLICIFTECKNHLDRSLSRLMICESTDRGRTWSEKKPFTGYTENNSYYNNARITKLTDGSLVVLCDLIEGWEDKAGTVYMWKGDSEGENWIGPIETPGRGIVPDKLKELQSGRWLLACHHSNPVTEKLEEYLWYSDDRGETWSDRVLLASDIRYNLCEASILETKQGILVAFLRENSFKGMEGFKAISRDNGETWEGVFPTLLPGCHRPTAGYLQDGSIMVTYRYLQGGKIEMYKVTQNAFASFMSEETLLATKRNEQTVRTMPIDYDRSKVPDTGYTGWAQFDDGEIYVVNYIVDDAPKAQIRGYSFYPKDVVL